MRRWAMLRHKKGDLVKDLKETTLSFKKLGKKYGVSKQAVHGFSRRQGIKRPVKPEGHRIEECSFCQKLLQISKEPHSEFISSPTIVKKMGRSRERCLYHLKRLKERGLIDEKFGRLRSEKAEKAYAMYFTERLPIGTIGRKVGYKSFYMTIRRHRALGWSIPPPLYVYDRRERRWILSKMHRRKKR